MPQITASVSAECLDVYAKPNSRSEINMYPILNFVPSAFCRNGSKLLSAWSFLSRFVLSKVSVHGKLATDLGKVVTFKLLSQCLSCI